MTKKGQTEEKDGFGLDKDARLKSKRAAELKEQKAKPLNPKFPYRVIEFETGMVI